MSKIYLKADHAAVPTGFGADIVLDMWPPAATMSIHVGGIERVTGPLTAPALDFLRIATALYCTDKLVRRDSADDLWTREFLLSAPVHDVTRWKRSRPAFENGLRFLSQDAWTVKFRAEPAKADRGVADRFDAVSLFSGGLDSLIGAIDLLESDPNLRVLLVGHHDAPSTETVQRALFARIRENYGERVDYLSVLARPNRNANAEYQLPSDRENTTRTRSVVFIAAGIAAASASGPKVPLFVPENGFIAMNVPLGENRLGSCSTRTTHPHFIQLLVSALREVGIQNPIRNPFLYQTKGQMLDGCRNQNLLKTLEGDSVSCSHPDQKRYEQSNKNNCGYCYPCIIRRASFHAVGRDRAFSYRYDITRNLNLIRNVSRGADARAVFQSLLDDPGPLAVFRQGPLPSVIDVERLNNMYLAGRDELRDLFADKATKKVRDYAGL